MNKIYYSIKCQVMRIPCLFGKHDIMFSALGYHQPGCLWCKKKIVNDDDYTEEEIVKMCKDTRKKLYDRRRHSECTHIWGLTDSFCVVCSECGLEL